MSERAFHQYFRSKHGRWQGDYRFTVTHAGALLSSSMGLFDRLLFASFGVLCRLLGSLRIDTSIDARGLDRGRVVHTTRISKWGVAVQRSQETFELGADGSRFEVAGWLCMLPFPWIRWRYRQSWGTVDERGQHASYEFRWGGVRLMQETRPHGEGLDVTQTTDGCRAAFLLRPIDSGSGVPLA